MLQFKLCASSVAVGRAHAAMFLCLHKHKSSKNNGGGRPKHDTRLLAALLYRKTFFTALPNTELQSPQLIHIPLFDIDIKECFS